MFLKSKRKKDKKIFDMLTQNISENLKGEEVVFSFKYNLSCSNTFVYGICSVSKNMLIKAQTDAFFSKNIDISLVNISSISEITCTRKYGCAVLEYSSCGSTYEFCRTTNKNSDFVFDMCKTVGNLKKDPLYTVENKSKNKARRTRENIKSSDFLKIAKQLLSMVKPYIPVLLVCGLLFIVAAGLELLFPYLNKILVDDYIKGSAETVSFSAFMILIFALAATKLIMTVFDVIRNRLLINVSSDMLKKLRFRLFEKIQYMSLSEISEHTTGELMTRLTNDTAILNRFLVNVLPEFIQQTLVLIAIIVAMLVVFGPAITLIAIIPCPFVLLMYNFIHRFLHRIYHKQWFIESYSNTTLHDIFQGIRVIKAYGTERAEEKKYSDIIKNESEVRQKNEALWSIIIPMSGFLMGIGEFIILYYVGNKILKGSMSLGQLVQLTSYVSIIYAPLNFFSRLPRILIHTGTAVFKIFEILNGKTEIADSASAKNITVFGDVEFKNICFGYKEHEPVLENISFSVHPGEMVGIVGASGVGKSTLINLVMRLYEADSGQILIDGTDIRDISQSSLREQTGAVLQESFLFSGTIYDNIVYAKKDASKDEVIRAAKLAGAHSFIMNLPDAYNTKIGERGYTLSGGERQRISIARVFLKNPRILILDEATSSLDIQTEKVIQDALAKLIKNRTTFAIAHRLSTLRNATFLVVLDKGRVAEIGTHDFLMNKKGIYYDLVLAQRQMSKKE